MLSPRGCPCVPRRTSPGALCASSRRSLSYWATSRRLTKRAHERRPPRNSRYGQSCNVGCLRSPLIDRVAKGTKGRRSEFGCQAGLASARKAGFPRGSGSRLEPFAFRVRWTVAARASGSPHALDARREPERRATVQQSNHAEAQWFSGNRFASRALVLRPAIPSPQAPRAWPDQLGRSPM
jgi:hypothetical protein